MPVRARQFRKKTGSGWLRILLYSFFPFLFLALCLIFLLAWKSGNALVHQDDFNRITWAVVLAGESRNCERTAAAMDLFKQNRIDTLLLSSIRIFKSHYVGEYIIPDLVGEGIPRERLFELRHDSYSTIEEAIIIIQQLRGLGVDTALIITSNFHTRRARMIFKKLAGGYPEFLYYPAAFAGYDPDAWWASRTSLKHHFLEWLKFIANGFELLTRRHKAGPGNSDRILRALPDSSLRSRFGHSPISEFITITEKTGPDGSLADTAGFSDSTENIHKGD